MKKYLIPIAAAVAFSLAPIIASACVIEGDGYACDDGGCQPVHIHISYPGPCQQ